MAQIDKILNHNIFKKKVRRTNQLPINKRVLRISVLTGGIAWILCQSLYSAYKWKIAGVLMIPTLCTILFAGVFLSVWAGSAATGSFDRKSFFYSGWKSMLVFFIMGAAAVFSLTMMLEFVYELKGKQKEIEPSSYIFVLDESGSMLGNDSDGLRYAAVQEIMKNSSASLPYMIYAFSDEPQMLRNMAVQAENEPKLPVTCSGATAIVETTLRILQDYKDKKWDGGKNPKIIFLTDGCATDLRNGFFGFQGNIREFNKALEEYNNLGISISTVGIGSADKKLMSKMAETTGGVFINVDQATDLAEAMRAAATSYSERDLLSIRYMKQKDHLFGFLRILFLSLIGLLIGSLMALAYMDDKSTQLILMNSAAGSVLGSVLLELGVQNGMSQGALWFFLWILFSMTVGYLSPKKRRFGTSFLGEKRRKKGCQIQKGQELNHANVRV